MSLLNAKPFRQTLVIATGNPGKVREFEKILGSDSFEFKTLKDIGFEDEIIESGTTFAANAVIKAEAVFAACGLAVLADDSGLEVDALDGAPGIFTARFAGPKATDDDNIDKLLNDLQSGHNRKARFKCALCFMDANTAPLVFEGACEGEILPYRMGNQGFGYDPIFLADGQNKSFGEMDAAEKKALSHRGMAIKLFQAWLQENPIQ
jgi:XTP/dITP diphosphohydrolase